MSANTDRPIAPSVTSAKHSPPSPPKPSQVSLQAAHSYERDALTAALVKLLAPLGGIEAIVKPGDRVLLKPNLLTGARPTKECTTRPELVYCVAKLVQKAGGKPFLGDSPAFGSAAGVAKANGLDQLAAELNLPIVEFHGQRFAIGAEQAQQREHDLQHLRLSKEALGADVIINLPKVKSHAQMTLTVGVKNLFGCVPGKMKAWWHMELGKDINKFARMLIETAIAISPQLTIVDGIIGHEGNGPSGGEPRNLGVLAASTDVFAVDRVVTEILSIDSQQVPIMAESIRLGLCADLSDIEIVGSELEQLRLSDWQLPEKLIPVDFGMPRIVKSTFKHFYIKFIKEPISAYARTS
ncbi:protein of unknown function DUF362 [Thalassoporum mexicanum PCC 7367]|uniref:DUF362 domain-containing protein n=1 Tax=Thalassoporum mexicanum TaxID=3457544 RepID=UPI00029F9FF3|nr:DUF362 domain-containing protein [Pseudanabaena sp. PCC 7367]AFY71471.1 protein of unknown function DUF362 [Pseudanabaena sp. PCC 7367]